MCVTWTALLQLRYAACGAIQVLYAFAFNIKLHTSNMDTITVPLQYGYITDWPSLCITGYWFQLVWPQRLLWHDMGSSSEQCYRSLNFRSQTLVNITSNRWDQSLMHLLLCYVRWFCVGVWFWMLDTVYLLTKHKCITVWMLLCV